MGEDFVRALVGLPKFLFGYTVGLAIYLLTDYNLFSMLLTGVAAGLVAKSILIGVLVFFALYVLSRIISHGFSQIAEAIAYHAKTQAMVNPPVDPGP